MQTIDWILFFGFLIYTVWDGVRRTRRTRTADDYFLAGRNVSWWAMGLSIMATQASAITMVGTTGQGWADGLRFIQFYFALPLAMIVLAFTAVPLYHRHRVTTAYEYLGVRFDDRTRLLSAVLFLILRGLSVGFVIYAPSLVLAKVFGFPLGVTVLVMGGVAVVYTSVGGLGAVIRTDVKQMTVMTFGLIAAVVVLVIRIPDGVGFSGAVDLARETGHLRAVDWSWNPAEKYTVWSSLIGGLFLFLSYFGTDQSQVQRLLAGRSIAATRGALYLNAAAKVPFQFLVLGCGVLLFVFYTFTIPPVTFEPVPAARVVELREDADYRMVEEEFRTVRVEVARAASEVVATGDAGARERYRALLAESEGLRDRAREIRGGVGDTNFVFLDFILHHLPVGLAGLLLAAIFAAALSSIDSELNAMTTVAVLDVVQHARRSPLTGVRLVAVSRLATLAVGAFATAFALYAGRMGSLIEAVNRVGSYVYGSLLGAFVLAVAVPRANGTGAFVGLLAGMVTVGIASRTDLAFLYLNTVGTVTVVAVGTVVSLLTGGRATSDAKGR